MTHETAVLLARACQEIDIALHAAADAGDIGSVNDYITGAMLLRHVFKYMIDGEEQYGRS